MRRHWENEASAYTAGRRWSPVDQAVLEELKLKAGDGLLEIGFGSGLVARRILETYPGVRYYGLDVTDAFIQSAKEIIGAPARLVKGDVRVLPFLPDSFDIILEMDAIHHVPREDLIGVLTELSQALKKGGRLISAEDWAIPPVDERARLADSLQRRRPLVRDGWEYHPDEDEWLELFNRAGLEVERLRRIIRPLNLDRFAGISEAQAQNDLARLRELWVGETPVISMTLFTCKKR